MTRARLPNRRLGETFEFALGQLRFTCTIGRFQDRHVAEIFIQNHKPGSQAAGRCSGRIVGPAIRLPAGCPATSIAT
jgi:hypothetical protein